MSVKPQASQMRVPGPGRIIGTDSPAPARAPPDPPGRAPGDGRGELDLDLATGVEARVAGGGVSGTTASQLTSASAWVDGRDFSIHLRTRLALTPWARATAATDAPGTRHSATIAAFSSGLRRT
jgi:hypothetical protein